MTKHLHFEERGDEEIKKFEEEFHPRQEYIRGEIPFAYQHEFSSGETVEAFQDEDGTGHVAIKKNAETIFDFSDLLPPGFVMVAPKYFETHPEKRKPGEPIGWWGATPKRKMILLGDFKNSKDILSLLHEIGHIKKNIPEENEKRLKLLRGSPEDFFDWPQTVVSKEELAKLQSKLEREAWAWAIGAMRKTEEETGVALSEIFSSFSDLKRYINEHLGSYRRAHEWIMQGGFDEDFYKEMEKLFDRWKYALAGEDEKN